MLNLRQTLFATSFALAASILGANAQAGAVTEYSSDWKPGFSRTDRTGVNQYERTVYVEHDTGYKTGNTRVTRTIQLSGYKPGAELSENGYELQVIEFDPSQVETAGESMDNRPLVSTTAKPGYFLDDSDHKYHLVK